MATKKSDILDLLKGVEKSVGNDGKKCKPRLVLGNQVVEAKIVSFGIPSLDAASNAGGFARGGIIELFGPESSGKSYASYKAIASVQAAGLEAALLDVENAYWPEWVAKAGVDISRLVIGQSFESGEQCLMYAKALAETRKFGIVVVDSIAALLPQVEAESELDDKARVGAHAAMMSRCLRMIKGSFSSTDTALLCINQTRNKIGVMFGNPEDTPGGKALKFYADMRIGLQHIGREKAKIDGVEKDVGVRTKCRFIKNKVGQPYGEDEFVIYSVEGINTPMVQLVNLAIRLKVVPGRRAFNEDDPDKKTFVWKDADGDAVDTECKTASDLSEWFEANDLVPTVVDMIIERAKKKGDIDVPADILSLKGPPKAEEAKVEEKPA